MTETLRQKRAKPRLSLTYSFVCTGCNEIEEAPRDLTCGACGQPMYSLSRLYRFGIQKIQENLEAAIAAQKKKTPVRGDARPGHEGEDINLTLYLTAGASEHRDSLPGPVGGRKERDP